MVSADNLNLDVLELIFAFLSGNDLPSVALVSRSFLAAVIPRLYNTISYRLRGAKGYDVVSTSAGLQLLLVERWIEVGCDLKKGETMSPFAAVLAHPQLAIHVRNIGTQLKLYWRNMVVTDPFMQKSVQCQPWNPWYTLCLFESAERQYGYART